MTPNRPSTDRPRKRTRIFFTEEQRQKIQRYQNPQNRPLCLEKQVNDGFKAQHRTIEVRIIHYCIQH